MPLVTLRIVLEVELLEVMAQSLTFSLIQSRTTEQEGLTNLITGVMLPKNPYENLDTDIFFFLIILMITLTDFA